MDDRNYPARFYDDTISVDLLNLFGHILLKWKLLLIASLIGAIIGLIFGIMKTGTASPETETSIDLSDDQMAEAEEYYSQLSAYDDIIDKQKKYNDDSYIMSLDPQTAVGCRLQYLIISDLEDVSSVYTSSILSDEDYREIADILGPDIGKTGLNDVMIFDMHNRGDSDIVTSNRKILYDDIIYKNIVMVTVICPDKTSCESITEIVNKAFQRESGLLKDNGVTIECTLINRISNLGVNDVIISAKQRGVNALGTLMVSKRDFTTNVVNKLDDEERDYIEMLNGSKSINTNKVSTQESRSYKGMLKYPFMGLFVFLLFATVLLIVRYIIQGTLHTEDDLKNGLRISVLQTLTAGSLKDSISNVDFISRWGLKCIGVNDEIHDSFSILLNELEKRNEHGRASVYIATDEISDHSRELAQRIVKEITGDNTYIIGSLHPTPFDMKNLLNADEVIILPVMDRTKVSSITLLLDICERNGKNTISCVPIRDLSLI